MAKKTLGSRILVSRLGLSIYNNVKNIVLLGHNHQLIKASTFRTAQKDCISAEMSLYIKSKNIKWRRGAVLWSRQPSTHLMNNDSTKQETCRVRKSTCVSAFLQRCSETTEINRPNGLLPNKEYHSDMIDSFFSRTYQIRTSNDVIKTQPAAFVFTAVTCVAARRRWCACVTPTLEQARAWCHAHHSSRRYFINLQRHVRSYDIWRSWLYDCHIKKKGRITAFY